MAPYAPISNERTQTNLNMKRRELMKYMNSNPYQMIDDYNSASL